MPELTCTWFSCSRFPHGEFKINTMLAVLLTFIFISSSTNCPRVTGLNIDFNLGINFFPLSPLYTVWYSRLTMVVCSLSWRKCAAVVSLWLAGASRPVVVTVFTVPSEKGYNRDCGYFNMTHIQSVSLHHLLSEKDVLSCLPTGYGRSFIYKAWSIVSLNIFVAMAQATMAVIGWKKWKHFICLNMDTSKSSTE